MLALQRRPQFRVHPPGGPSFLRDAIVYRVQARIDASRQQLPCICQPIVEADGAR